MCGKFSRTFIRCHMKQTLLLLLLVVTTVQASLAGVLKGNVTDTKGEAMGFATIFVQGTTIGTNANAGGEYELTLVPGNYTVICQFIGYKQARFNVTITGSESITHNFKLNTEGLEMKEVVISSEDRAYRIVRQAIKKRQLHLAQVHSFQSNIYLKGKIGTRESPKKVMGKKIDFNELGTDTAGKGIIYLLEEDADYYSSGDKERTVIHSVRESGNPGGVGFSQFPSVITFYENNIPLFGRSSRGYISPISDNALNYYKYKLLGQFEEGGRTIYKIQVKQKRPYEPCFNGNIYIADEDFTLHSTNLTLTRESGMDRLDTFSITQLYLPMRDSTWVIKSQIIYFTIKILGFDAVGSLVTVYNRQKVNEPIADSMFAGKVVSSYDKIANKKDSTYWEANRPIPLEADEKRDFVVKDSVRIVNEDPNRMDSIRRKGNKPTAMQVLLTGYTYNGKANKNIYSFNSLLLGFSQDNIINFNSVEGFNLAPRVNIRHRVDTGKMIIGDVAARYGFSNTHFNAIGRLYYAKSDREWLGRIWMAGVEGGKYVFQYNPDNPVLQWFNTYASLFYKENDLRIYERWEGSAFVRRHYGNGLSWMVKASFQRRLPLINTTDYSFSADSKPYYSNLPPHLANAATTWDEHNAAIVYGMISYKPGITYTQFPDYKVPNNSSWPRFTLTYEKGLPNIFNSKSDFDKWKFNIQDDDVSLRLLGSLSYNFAVGGFLNTTYVSIPDLMHLYGNRGIGYTAPYLQSFQFAQYYDFSNKENLYGEAHVEYHLKGLLSNKIPGLKQAQWHIITGGNAFYASEHNYYTEAFVGLENIGYKVLRILRVDFVQSWDSNRGRNSGIRFGLTSPAFNRKPNLTHSEW